MTNAERILAELDKRLDSQVELTLYGRAAFLLGFDNPPEQFSQSMDVDAVLWLGQAQDLIDRSNFWEALETTNLALESEGLYMSHLFEENQVILSSGWRGKRVAISGTWLHLSLFRLSDEDLLLSKLMRNDPQDRADGKFIVERQNWSRSKLLEIVGLAVIPDLPELREEFAMASEAILRDI